MKIYFSKKDLYKCFKFAVMYFLDETKSKENRTTGQYRGLGSIINDFFIGKLIELGVKKSIERYNKKIKCELDFTLHGLGENHRSDPDIIGVIQNRRKRDPQLYVETKNVSENDRYIGLTKNQLNTMLENKIASKNLQKLFIVYANICTKNTKKNSDIFGVYLRSKISDKLLHNFANVNEIFLSIKNIIKGSELIKHGTEFNNKSFFYETNILSEALNKHKAEKIRKSGYKTKRLKNCRLPVVMMRDYPKPKEFGKIKLIGKINLIIKKNNKSKSVFADCLNNSILKNKVIGNFKLKKGNMYKLYFTTIGRNPRLNRNNIWIANRNLNNIIKIPITKRLKYIAKNI